MTTDIVISPVTAATLPAGSTVRLSRAQCRQLLALVGGESYKGRKLTLVVQESYTLNNGDLVYDGGSKTEVTFIRHAGKSFEIVDGLTALGCPIATGGRTMSGAIPQNVVIVERVFFCGHDLGFRFIVAPRAGGVVGGALGASSPQLPTAPLQLSTEK